MECFFYFQDRLYQPSVEGFIRIQAEDVIVSGKPHSIIFLADIPPEFFQVYGSAEALSYFNSIVGGIRIYNDYFVGHFPDRVDAAGDVVLFVEGYYDYRQGIQWQLTLVIYLYY